MVDSHKGSILETQHITTHRDSSVANEQNYQTFQNFLEQSHYAQTRKSTLKSSDLAEDKTFNKDLDNYFNYFEVRKKDLVQTTESQAEPPGFNAEVSPIKIRDIDAFHENNFMLESPHPEDEIKKMVMSPQFTDVNSPLKRMDSQGFDKNMKKLVEMMQAKMIKTEQENRKLKKEVYDLTTQNKKLQNQISSFITEQENFTRTKENYEKRLKKLQDYCKNSEETMASLKKILSLQEDELYDILKKQNAPYFGSPKNGGQDTKRSLKKTGTKDSQEDFPIGSPERNRTSFVYPNSSLPMSKASSINMLDSPSRANRVSIQKGK